jgi:hypothetical protein
MGINLMDQMVHYFADQNDHPNHNKHVKIDLSKMTYGFFYTCLNWVFFY